MNVEIIENSDLDEVKMEMKNGGKEEERIMRRIGMVMNEGKKKVVRINVGRLDMERREIDFGENEVIDKMIN